MISSFVLVAIPGEVTRHVSAVHGSWVAIASNRVTWSTSSGSRCSWAGHTHTEDPDEAVAQDAACGGGRSVCASPGMLTTIRAPHAAVPTAHTDRARVAFDRCRVRARSASAGAETMRAAAIAWRAIYGTDGACQGWFVAGIGAPIMASARLITSAIAGAQIAERTRIPRICPIPTALAPTRNAWSANVPVREPATAPSMAAVVAAAAVVTTIGATTSPISAASTWAVSSWPTRRLDDVSSRSSPYVSRAAVRYAAAAAMRPDVYSDGTPIQRSVSSHECDHASTRRKQIASQPRTTVAEAIQSLGFRSS